MTEIDQRKRIGQIVRDARRALRLSQLDIERRAREHGWVFSQPSLSSIENGRQPLSNVRALILMAILGCRCLELVSLKINPRFLEAIRDDPAPQAFMQEFCLRFPASPEGFTPSIDGWSREVAHTALERVRQKRPGLLEENWRSLPRGPRWPTPVAE